MVEAIGADMRHLEAFLEMMAAERGAARNTIEAYRRDIGDFARFLRGAPGFLRGEPGAATPIDATLIEAPLIEAAADDIRAYLAALAGSGLAARSAARRVSVLRQFFGFLVAEGLRADDPLAAIDAPRRGRTLPKVLSQSEVEALLSAARARRGFRGARLLAMLELLYASGLRVSELVALPLGALSSDRGIVRVRGKGAKERLVPIGRPAQAALRAWMPPRLRALAGAPSSPFLFPSRGRGGHLSGAHFARQLKALAAECGLDPGRVSPHVLRHAFATHLLAGEADLRSVQRMLGHADLATTEIYTHIADDRPGALVRSRHPLAGPI